MSIEFKEGAVCFAYGKQWRYFCNNGAGTLLIDNSDNGASLDYVLMYENFQLNTIKHGDYIEALELDTKQKYYDAVEVFGLLGFDRLYDYDEFSSNVDSHSRLIVINGGVDTCVESYQLAERKINYDQLMAIGELKRLMNERDKNPTRRVDVSCDSERLTKEELKRLLVEGEKSNHSAKPNSSVSKVNRDIERPASDDQVKKPSHYQLIEGVESIEIIARAMTKEQWHGFCLGNMLKYRIRAGKKDKLQQDIDKANFYGELYEMHKEKCYEANDNKENAG